MSLQSRAIAAFDDALAATAPEPEALAPVRAALSEARAHLDEPMRVAIVGQIKAGKSTLLNALLGEDVVATGTEELTYNVNWLRYGEEPGLVVHFKDGRAPERREPGELEELTRRRDEHRELLSSIAHIDVVRPNEILRTFSLIDTPGLASYFGEDERNTLDFLGLSADDVSDATRAESRNADAILCLFGRSLGAADQATVQDFRGSLLGDATPINSIGVLTRCDGYWTAPTGAPGEKAVDPMAVGRGVADRIQHEPGADSIFYAVLPVCALLGFGARTLTDDEGENLIKLAGLTDERMAKLVRSAERFATRDYDDVPVPAAGRAVLLGRLGLYGVWLARDLLREAGDDLEAVRAELWRRSGMEALRSLVVSHFGHRALLIKLQSGLGRAGAVSFREGQRLDGEAARAADAAAGRLEALERSEHALEELGLLRRFYHDADGLELTEDEAEELLRITGEHGTNVAARLGLDRRATTGELRARAEDRLDHWRVRADGFGVAPTTIAASRVMTAAYERIVFHVREAHRHLELDQ